MKSSPSFFTLNNPSKQSSDDLANMANEGNSDDMPKLNWIYSNLLHKDARISKLMTHEDNYHIHKTLGILSVISFFYRYGYVYSMQGNLGFDGTDASRDHRLVTLDWLTMIVHTVLALSSVIFRVPKKRINNKPMVIYEEYRQHAMVFTLRCFSVFFVAYVFPTAPAFVVPVVVMAHHLLADRITSIWGTPGNTAVRATSAAVKLSAFYAGVSKVYSLYQFLAIASHILPNDRLGDLAYNAIIAIQSSAFMMTLYRKRIIRGTTHMVVYALCLLLSAFHICRLLGWQVVLGVVVAFFVRINLPRALGDKYLIWTLFMVASNWSYFTSIVPLVPTVLMTVGDASQSLMAALASNEDLFLASKGTATALLVYTAFKGERLLFEGATGTSNPPTPSTSRSDLTKEE